MLFFQQRNVILFQWISCFISGACCYKPWVSPSHFDTQTLNLSILLLKWNWDMNHAISIQHNCTSSQRLSQSYPLNFLLIVIVIVTLLQQYFFYLPPKGIWLSLVLAKKMQNLGESQQEKMRQHFCFYLILKHWQNLLISFLLNCNHMIMTLTDGAKSKSFPWIYSLQLKKFPLISQ